MPAINRKRPPHESAAAASRVNAREQQEKRQLHRADCGAPEPVYSPPREEGWTRSGRGGRSNRTLRLSDDDVCFAQTAHRTFNIGTQDFQTNDPSSIDRAPIAQPAALLRRILRARSADTQSVPRG